MNFFEGVVSDGGGSGPSVTLGEGLTLPLGREDLSGQTGRRVTLGMRPEHISMAPAGRSVSDIAWAVIGKPARVPVTIEVVEPLGHRVVVTARSAAGPVQMETELHAGVRTGEDVDLWFDMNRSYLFDAGTEDAI